MAGGGLQVLSLDWLGQKVGTAVLAFRVGDRDLTTHCRLLREEELDFDVFYLAEALKE